MLKILLGVLDLLAAVILVLLKFKPIAVLGLIFGVYLIIKGFVFLDSLASVVDIVCGILVIIAGYGHYTIINFLFVLWLLQKAYLSIIA